MSYPITDIDGLTARSPWFSSRWELGRATVCSRLPVRFEDGSPSPRRPVLKRSSCVLGQRCGPNAHQGRPQGHAELLQAAGVDTAKELVSESRQLAGHAMADANKKRKLVRLLPSEKVVKRWIENARTLPLKITY